MINIGLERKINLKEDRYKAFIYPRVYLYNFFGIDYCSQSHCCIYRQLNEATGYKHALQQRPKAAVWRGFSSQLGGVRLGTKGDPTPDVWLLSDAADRNGPRRQGNANVLRSIYRLWNCVQPQSTTTGVNKACLISSIPARCCALRAFCAVLLEYYGNNGGRRSKSVSGQWTPRAADSTRNSAFRLGWKYNPQSTVLRFV